jgi:hypothetical protein
VFTLLRSELQLLMVTVVARQSVGSKIKAESVTDWAAVRAQRPIKALVIMADVVR